jgi:hypothetical protein
MLRLKERMVRVVLMVLSEITAALTPGKVALRQVPVPLAKSRFSARSRR